MPRGCECQVKSRDKNELQRGCYEIRTSGAEAYASLQPKGTISLNSQLLGRNNGFAGGIEKHITFLGIPDFVTERPNGYFQSLLVPS